MEMAFQIFYSLLRPYARRPAIFYRCYNLSRSGTTTGIKNFQASTDTEAWLIADKIQSDGRWYALEMWEGLRRVVRPFDLPDAAA
jgi:hypothetical protein